LMEAVDGRRVISIQMQIGTSSIGKARWSIGGR
jgi:hypothetical protein